MLVSQSPNAAILPAILIVSPTVVVTISSKVIAIDVEVEPELVLVDVVVAVLEVVVVVVVVPDKSNISGAQNISGADG